MAKASRQPSDCTRSTERAARPAHARSGCHRQRPRQVAKGAHACAEMAADERSSHAGVGVAPTASEVQPARVDAIHGRSALGRVDAAEDRVARRVGKGLPHTGEHARTQHLIEAMSGCLPHRRRRPHRPAHTHERTLQHGTRKHQRQAYAAFAGWRSGLDYSS